MKTRMRIILHIVKYRLTPAPRAGYRDALRVYIFIYYDSFDVYECLLAEKVAKPFGSNRQRKCMVQNFYVEVVLWL